MIKPLAGYVLVQDEEPRKIGAMDITPDEGEKDKNVIGLVVECGKNTDSKKCPVKKGDKVVYKKYTSNEVEVGEVYRIIEFDNLIALIK